MSCSHSTQKQNNHSRPMPSITVNGSVIDEGELGLELQYHPADSEDEALFKAARALVIKYLLLQKSEQLGIEATPFDHENKEEAVIRCVLDKEVQVPEASEQACKHYFDNNSQRFVTEPLVSASHILLAAAKDDPARREHTRRQAEQLIEDLQSYSSDQQSVVFAQLAGEYSDCPSGKTRGELGQISKGQTTPEFERQLFSMEEGLAARPVESRYGYHVVRIDHKQPGKPLNYEMVSTKIRDYLNACVRHKAIQQYISVLVSEAEITGIDLSCEDNLMV